jgi:hypothetical protein
MKRISKRELREIATRLNSKDQAILSVIQTCRYITSRQLMRLFFVPVAHFNRSASMRNANRHLYRLKEWGLIAHLERRIGGVRAGSGANIWYLTEAGYSVLRLYEVNNSDSTIRRKRHHEPTLHFAKHHLAVSEVYVRLHELTGKRQAIDLTAIALEPVCWREFPNLIGAKPAILKPDLYAVTAVKDNASSEEYEDYWFIEVDLDTEAPATVIRKCEQYIRYLQSGIEEREYGVFPRVVWIVPTDKRKSSLEQHIENNFMGVERELFVVITLDALPRLLGADKDKPAKEE